MLERYIDPLHCILISFFCSPNRFSFGSRKNRGLQQQAAVAAAPRKRFGFGSKRNAHHQPKVVATKPKRFGFGSKKAARQQPYESAGAPAALQSIKAKISPNPAPVGTSKRTRKQGKKNEATSLAKKFAPLAFAKARSSRKQPRHAPPPTAKRGFLSSLTSSRNRRRY